MVSFDTEAKIENGGSSDLRRESEDVIEAPVSSHDRQPDTIADWLLSLGLQQYLGLMVSNGFDDIDFLVSEPPLLPFSISLIGHTG